MTKKECRSQLRETWNRISPEEIEIISANICRSIEGLREWQSSSSIFAYLSFGREICLDSLIRAGLAAGKETAVPLIESSTTMTFRALKQWDPGEFVLNKWGIREPRRDSPVVAPDKNGIILVPGLGFTAQGERMGRGGGFYDRYLAGADLSETLLIGITCDACLREFIPTEEGLDRKVDMICTESGILNP